LTVEKAIEAGAYREDDLREICRRNDLSYFAEDMLGMEIMPHHEEWSNHVLKYNRLAINAARDHGKSYFFSFAYVIWRIYYAWLPNFPADLGKSIPKKPLGYIFSSTEDNAIHFLEEVKDELESNPRLQHLVPIRRNINWGKKEIVASNGVRVRARGWGVKVRGGHPVWAVVDDVLNDESIYSEIQRQKQIDYFYSALTPMVVPFGQIAVIGTPFHDEDLYGDLKKNSEYFFKSYPAIKEDGTALWPTRYSRPMLEQKKREIGSVRFTREYLTVPIADANSLFPEKVVRENFRDDLSLLTKADDNIHNEYEIYTGVDLALSANVGADYTVIFTIGVDKYKNRRIIDIRRFKGRGMTDQLREIEDVYRSFRPRKILIEDNQFQKVFADELVKNTDLPVEGFTTTAHHKNSLERGVPSLQILFENKKWMIPRKTDRDRRLMDEVIHELRCFTYIDGKLQGLGAHDDIVMAMWIANECALSSPFTFNFV
jgi:hypothetical protein